MKTSNEGPPGQERRGAGDKAVWEEGKRRLKKNIHVCEMGGQG